MGTHQPIATPEKNGAVWLAGEASGDFIASLVLPEVERRMDGAPQYGVGGARMRAAGFHAWHDISELSVRGYVEVLSHLPRLLRLRSELVQSFANSNPRVFVGVDAPDFNLDIEAKLRRRGVPIVHFVSPAIWAWRPERIHKIRTAVDHMLLVFPFEQEIYKRAGIPATYVGHPLASVIPMEPDTVGARADFGLNEDSLPVVTVLPGSRIDEVKGCAPAFFGAVEKLLHRYGDMHVLIPAADERARENIIFLAGQYARLAQRMIVRVGTSHRMMEAADAVLVASGDGGLGGGALQEADGCRLQDACRDRHDHAEEGARSPCVAAQYSAWRKCRSRVPAVLLRSRSDLLGARAGARRRNESSESRRTLHDATRKPQGRHGEPRCRGHHGDRCA
mgnify:CR=1 FL=1